jgi:acetyl-CoA synthetase
MPALDGRVAELLVKFDKQERSVADLLCDGYDAADLAYRIVHRDLTSRDLTYGELKHESERFAAGLARLGVGKGDRVATLMGKSRSLVVTVMAIWRLGAVYVPMFTAFAPPAIALRLNGSGAKCVICDVSQEAKLQPGIDIPATAPWTTITTGSGHDDILSFDAVASSSDDEVAACATAGDDAIIHIFTSGTTGKPKGVVVPKRALAAFQAYGEFGLDLRKDDLYWCAADPGWAYGLYFGILSSLTTGTHSLLLEGGFTPETTLAVLSRFGVTNFTAAPTVYRSLRAAGLSVPSGLPLRCASSAGEPLTPDVNEWAATNLGVPVHDHYGQTEAGMLINNHHHSDLNRPLKQGSMGQPMPGWSAVILHETRDEPVGPNVKGRVAMDLEASPLAWFRGYPLDPGKSAEKFAGGGRWYLTGDVGSMDDDNYFRFSSRDDDVIIMAGYRIGPFEIESVLATHPAVLESAVIAVPDDIRGEVLEAFVVLRDDARPDQSLEQELQQWVKVRYAAHAYPRTVHFLKGLPKTPSGKVQRFVLRQQRRADCSSPSQRD